MPHPRLSSLLKIAIRGGMTGDAQNLYARTLSDSFTVTFETDGRSLATFHSHPEGSVSAFREGVTAFCDTTPDTISFVGRAKADLHDFLLTLSERRCDDTKARVVTGDDASHLPDDEDLTWSLADSGITLDYTGLGHPKQWTVDSAPTARTHGDMEWFAHRMSEEFPKATLVDGQAIMAHDSVPVMIDAARWTGEKRPDSDDVYDALLRTADRDMVLGLSGPIEFGSDRNPVNKTIPILRTDWQAGAAVTDVVWPQGQISTRPSECS